VQTTYKDDISHEAISLIKSILNKDPEKRFTPKDILSHPWMNDCPKALDLFTKDEKNRIHKEFDYYR
jgi:serine/threonine protein kinase